MCEGNYLQVERIHVRNFRSINDLELDLPEFAVLCGPNGSGKTNLLQAILAAFGPDLTAEQVSANLPYSRRKARGGPGLSIWVRLTFKNVPSALSHFAGSPQATRLTYEFRAQRNGTITRRLANRQLQSIDEIRKHLDVVYVPPVRDLHAGGMSVFEKLFANALRRARGTRAFTREVQNGLAERADRLLDGQSDFVRSLLGARRLAADTSSIIVEGLYEKPALKAVYAHGEEPLEDHGTGHQSLVIINLYRQLGDTRPGSSLFLFEEPGNHLHPTMVRAIGSELAGLSRSSQVLATTHSPILINQVGLERVFVASRTASRNTEARRLSLGARKNSEVRALMGQFGIRAIEPLLAQRVVILEGPGDVTIIRVLAEKRLNRLLEASDVLLIPAGGKDGVARLAALVEDMGCDWRAVLDWDSAFSGTTPALDSRASDSFDSAVEAIEVLREVVDEETSRGRGLYKSFAALQKELVGDQKAPSALDGSVLLRLLRDAGLHTATLDRELKTALRNRRLRATWGLLEARGIVLWSGRIEDVMLTREGSIATTESALRQHSIPVNAHGSVDERRRRLVGQLHNLSARPHVLADIVRRLEDGGHFARTQMNRAMAFLFEGVQ